MNKEQLAGLRDKIAQIDSRKQLKEQVVSVPKTDDSKRVLELARQLTPRK